MTDILKQKTKPTDVRVISPWQQNVRSIFGEEWEKNRFALVDQLVAPPDRNELPAPINDFLDGIASMSPVEKIQKIHQFTLGYMRYEPGDPFDENFSSIPRVIAADGKGDCDDYASFEFGLLKLAGFEPENIEYLQGTYTNTTKSQLGSYTTKGIHAVTSVTVDDQPYLLDLQLSSPVIMDRNLEASLTPERKNNPYTTEVKINPFLIVNGDGNYTLYMDELKRAKQDSVGNVTPIQTPEQKPAPQFAP